MLGEQSAGTDGGGKPCEVSCGERGFALIPEAGVIVMEVDHRPPCVNVCVFDLCMTFHYRQHSEAHSMIQVPFLLNTGPEAQGPHSSVFSSISVLGCTALAPGGRVRPSLGDAQDEGGGGERLALGARAPCAGTSQVVRDSSFSTRPEEDITLSSSGSSRVVFGWKITVTLM